jgi:hypothetical protein
LRAPRANRRQSPARACHAYRPPARHAGRARTGLRRCRRFLRRSVIPGDPARSIRPSRRCAPIRPTPRSPCRSTLCRNPTSPRPNATS